MLAAATPNQNKETFISNFLDVLNYLRPLEQRIRVRGTHMLCVSLFTNVATCYFLYISQKLQTLDSVWIGKENFVRNIQLFIRILPRITLKKERTFISNKKRV